MRVWDLKAEDSAVFRVSADRLAFVRRGAANATALLWLGGATLRSRRHARAQTAAIISAAFLSAHSNFGVSTIARAYSSSRRRRYRKGGDATYALRSRRRSRAGQRASPLVFCAACAFCLHARLRDRSLACARARLQLKTTTQAAKRSNARAMKVDTRARRRRSRQRRSSRGDDDQLASGGAGRMSASAYERRTSVICGTFGRR